MEQDMKKFITSLAAIFMFSLGTAALAKTVPVTAITPFNSSNPPAEIAVKIGSNIQVTDDIVLFEGYTVKGKVVIQNGVLAFVPYSFINIHNEEAQFEPQTYGTFAGYVNNRQIVPVNSGAPVNVNSGQMFVLNFKDVIAKQTEMPQNVTESPVNVENIFVLFGYVVACALGVSIYDVRACSYSFFNRNSYRYHDC